MAPLDDDCDDREDKQAESEREVEEKEADDKEGKEPEVVDDKEEVESVPFGEWLDLMDGKIRKKVLVEGDGANPEMKQDVRITFDVRVAETNSPSAEEGEVLQSYKEWRYRMGEGEAVPMLELGVRHMKVGEEALIYGSVNMAFGPFGLKASSADEKAIPPSANICMRVVLHDIIDIRTSTTEWNEMIQEVTWRKTNGNDHFKRQEYSKAMKCYAQAVEVFSGTGFEPPEHIEEKHRPRARAAAMSLVTDCGANLAAVHLELGDAVPAKEAATAVLDACPEHMKGLYRMAKATLILDEFDECEKALEKGLKKDPENAALLRVEAELRQKQRRYDERSKKVAAKVFEGLDYPEPGPKKTPEQIEQEKEETEWIPYLKKTFQEWFVWQIAVGMVVASVLLAVVLTFMPKSKWPPVLITFIVGTPVVMGIWVGNKETNAEGDEKGGGKKQNKKPKRA